MPLAAGTRLGPYEILAPLGAGGMGEVYRARDPKLAREVAIKVLPADLAGNTTALARFEGEARAVAALSHPNILAIYDFGVSEGVPYAVTELLTGDTLRQRLDNGPLPQKRAVEIAREIALGLAAAHEAGIAHRDLKPENLFVTKDGRVKILDFGIARPLSRLTPGDTHSPTAAPETETEPGTVLGTVGYMAPEQVRGEKADHRSDIFSFGAVLYEMLSGRRAFHGDTSIETMNAILKEDPPELSASGKVVSPGLERIVSHCLEKKPDERFQSARDLAFDLSSLSSATASGAEKALAGASVRRRRLAMSIAAALALALVFWAGGRLVSRDPSPPVSFKRLTFRRGNLHSARFAPDGQTVVYGAAWEGRPGELFSVRTDAIESRPLDLDHANVLSVSSKGELAVKLGKGSFLIPDVAGTLARVPLGGGAPRQLLEDVSTAAWAPDGENMAVIRETEKGRQLEYPVGHSLLQSVSLEPNAIAMSPDGNLIAISEFSMADNSWAISVVDRQGKKKALTGGWKRVLGLAWSRPTGELLFIAGKGSAGTALRAVSLSGRVRVIWPTGGHVYLHDAALDGRLLLELSTDRRGIIWVAPGQTGEKELGWLDGSDLHDLSPDGTAILFTEAGDGAGSRGSVYLRRTDGSPALRLGDGSPASITPDGKWALAIEPGPPAGLVLLPTGPGAPRNVSVEGIVPLFARLFDHGRRIAVVHAAPGQPLLLSLVGLEGGKPVSLPGFSATNGLAFSPDGRLVAFSTTEGKILISPVEGGAARALPAPPLERDEAIWGWSEDARSLIVQTFVAVPRQVFRIDVETGRKTLWKEIQPADLSGIANIDTVFFTQDGGGYAYSYDRVQSSDLYVVEGLR